MNADQGRGGAGRLRGRASCCRRSRPTSSPSWRPAWSCTASTAPAPAVARRCRDRRRPTRTTSRRTRCWAGASHLPAGARRAHEPGSGAAGRLRGAAVRALPRHRLRHRARCRSCCSRAIRTRAGVGVEMQPRLAALAVRGRDDNGWRARWRSVEGDVRALGERLRRGRVRSGRDQPAVPDGGRAASRRPTRSERSRTTRSRCGWPSGSTSRHAPCARAAGWSPIFLPPARASCCAALETRGLASGAPAPRPPIRRPAPVSGAGRGRAGRARTFVTEAAARRARARRGYTAEVAQMLRGAKLSRIASSGGRLCRPELVAGRSEPFEGSDYCEAARL